MAKLTAKNSEFVPYNLARPKRVAVYLRVSTRRQASADVSLPSQKRLIDEHCNREGWIIADTYVERGRTATDDRRPEFRKLLDRAADSDRPYDLIVVHALHRFFRDGAVLEITLRDLRRRGVRLVFAGPGRCCCPGRARRPSESEGLSPLAGRAAWPAEGRLAQGVRCSVRRNPPAARADGGRCFSRGWAWRQPSPAPGGRRVCRMKKDRRQRPRLARKSNWRRNAHSRPGVADSPVAAAVLPSRRRRAHR